MPRPSKYNWEAIKEAYEMGFDRDEICKKHRITPKQLSNRINQYKWSTDQYNRDMAEVENLAKQIIEQVGFEQFELFVNNFSDSIKYLYIIKMDRHRYYKVGIAENVEKRLKTLQTGNPEKLTVVYKKEFAYVYQLEQHIHKKYNKNRKTGEWFTFTSEVLEEILNSLNNIKVFNGKEI